MQLPHEGTLLRIFIGEADRHEGRPLYEWIIERIEPHIKAGLVTLENAQVKFYRFQP